VSDHASVLPSTGGSERAALVRQRPNVMSGADVDWKRLAGLAEQHLAQVSPKR